MTRVLSAVALLPAVLGIVWFLDPIWTLALAEVVLLLAFLEYAEISNRIGAPFPKTTTAAAVLVACGTLTLVPSRFPAVLMVAMIGIGLIQLSAPRQTTTLTSASSAAFSVMYLALPIGAMAALRADAGRETLLLLIACVMASDTAQYYGGRAVGSRPLAPVISPKKTIEGAVFGIVAGVAVMLVLGRWWLPDVAPAFRAALGAAVAGFGIAGDLFESSLKRAAQMKDASSLIPGHGGVLDRIDALLFAAPVYYAVVQLSR